MNVVALFSVLFSTPLAALAIAVGGASIPIIIHLLNRKRFVVTDWAAMRFLQAAIKKNVRRVKVERWLLLATRILLIVLLVMAMASVMPWMESIWQRFFPGKPLALVSQGRTHRILVIDGSFTMAAAGEGDLIRFERAKAEAKAILEKAPRGDGFSLLMVSSPVQVIVPGPADDPQKISQEIDNLKLPHGNADIPAALNVLADMVNRPLEKFARREIVFFSDLRKSAWPTPSSANATDSGFSEIWKRIASGARIAFIDVAGRDLDNLAIASLTIGDALPITNVDLPVTATIHNFGRQPREKLRVDLLMGKAGDTGNLKSLGQKLIDLPAETSLPVTFAIEKQFRFREPGEYVLQVQIEEDGLPLDNVHSLTVHVRDRIPVMLVNGKSSPEPLERASEFLKRALNPFPDNEPSPDGPASVRVLNPREFQDAGLGDLFRPDQPTDIVFLCDVPIIGSNEAARLEAHLKRGGAVVIGLGPQSSQNIETYNRVLFNEGKGILPGPLVGIQKAENGQHFSLTTPVESFQQAPLSAFRSEEERASLSNPRFSRYVQINLPANTAARRLLSFVSSGKGPGGSDPAVLEWARHQGRVILFTSSLNADWNEWPRSLSYAPFFQELLRFAVAPSNRKTLIAGDGLEEYLPANFVGLTGSLSPWGGSEIRTAEVVSQDEAGLIRFPQVESSGIYRLSLGDKYQSLFAMNVPTRSALGGAASDLRRVSPESLTQLKAEESDADIHVASHYSDIRFRPDPTMGPQEALLAEPRGPGLARIVLFLVLGLLLIEGLLAWRFGSARAGPVADSKPIRPARWTTPFWFLPLLVAILLLVCILHADWTGQFLSFLPHTVHEQIETELGVPPSAPGEGTRWRLEALAPFTGDRGSDAWIAVALAVLVGLTMAWTYRRERLGGGKNGGRWTGPQGRLWLLRLAILLLGLFVLLPQVKLAMEREGWPDVVLVIDDSRSMSVIDQYRDPEVKESIQRLRVEWEKLAEPKIKALQSRAHEIGTLLGKSSSDPIKLREELAQIESRVVDLRTPHRLNLLKAMLARQDADWIKTILGRRKLRLHVYRVSTQASQLVDLSDVDQCSRLLEELDSIRPGGEASHLGEGVETVLKTFRGGSLGAIIFFTDAITTEGETLPAAAKSAARAGVPLYLLGLGDATEPIDLSIVDLRAEEVVMVNDRLILEAKLLSQGANLPEAVPVVLSELKEGRKVELTRQMVRLESQGKPAKIRFTHQPRETGEKTYVIETPSLPEENDLSNNRVEHRVFVEEAKKMRLLLVERVPRYDYRYVKSLFEREIDTPEGNKSVDLEVYLTTAHNDARKQDRTMIARFPTLEELRKYDAIILGDIDLKQAERGEAIAESLARYVKDYGGGLLMLAGQHFSPHSYRETPLADIMPIICDASAPPVGNETIRESFRPRLTTAGQGHSLFRFSSDDAENAEIWAKLTPLYWFATGYRKKLSAEVLAVHPERLAEPTPGASAGEENHPLVLQQFVGAGRVIFVGFDETWRWRWREDEMRFNQFWIQAVRTLARGRVGRIEVRTDRKSYRRGNPIRVTVRYPDDVAPPEGSIGLTVDRLPLRESVGGEVESRTIQLSPREGTRGSFEGLITTTPEGEYTLRLTDLPVGGYRPKAETRVLPPAGELDQTRLNEVELRQAAKLSHGEYYTPAQLDKIIDDLPEMKRPPLDQPRPPIQIWNHSLLFGLIIWLLTAEWIMRKKWRLL